MSDNSEPHLIRIGKLKKPRSKKENPKDAQPSEPNNGKDVKNIRERKIQSVCNGRGGRYY